MQRILGTLALFSMLGIAGPWCLKAVAGEDAPVVEQTVANVPAPVLCGDWSGTWTSGNTGHRGTLKATLTRVDASHYQVRFRGRFCKIIPFRYTTVLTATETGDGRIALSGQERLGLLMGTFRMSGWATSTQFVACYTSKDDHGQFFLNRCR